MHALVGRWQRVESFAINVHSYTGQYRYASRHSIMLPVRWRATIMEQDEKYTYVRKDTYGIGHDFYEEKE